MLILKKVLPLCKIEYIYPPFCMNQLITIILGNVVAYCNNSQIQKQEKKFNPRLKIF